MKLARMFMIVALLQSATPRVTLTWTDTNPVGTVGVTFNVKRATGICAGTPTLNTISTGVTAVTYVDNSVAVGSTYCYGVTAVAGGLESGLSNLASAAIVPSAPQVSVTVP